MLVTELHRSLITHAVAGHFSAAPSTPFFEPSIARQLSTRTHQKNEVLYGRAVVTNPVSLALLRLGLSSFLFSTAQNLVLQLSPKASLLSGLIALRASPCHGSLRSGMNVLSTAGRRASLFLLGGLCDSLVLRASLMSLFTVRVGGVGVWERREVLRIVIRV